MTELSELFSVIDAGAWSALLLDGAVKGTLLLALTGLLVLTMRQASAAQRHVLWSAAVVGVLVLPVLVLLVPTLPVPVLPGATEVQEALIVRAPASSDAGMVPLATLPAPGAEDAVPNVPEEKATEEKVAEGIKAAPVVKKSSPALARETPIPTLLSAQAKPVWDLRLPSLDWPSWVLLLWMTGAGILAIRWLLGIAGTWWLRHQSFEVTDPAWTQLTEDLAWIMDLSQPVTLVQSRRSVVPMTWGIIRPVVLLPAEADGWSEERRRVVLMHELAHVKRRDCLTQMMVQAVSLVYWFNPLVWLAARQIRIEREQACDDLVLNAGTKASSYATHILDLAGSLHAARPTAITTVAMARKSQLEGRLLAILDANRRRREPSRVGAVGAMGAMLLFVAPLAALKPVQATTPEPERVWLSVEVPESVGPLVMVAPQVAPVTPSVDFESAPEPVLAPGVAPDDEEATNRFWTEVVAEPIAGAMADFSTAVTEQLNDLFAAAMMQAYADSLTLDDLIRLKAAGVDAAFIREMRAAGFTDLSVEDLIQLSHADVDAEYVARLADLGFSDLTVNEIVQLSHADVDAEFVEEMTALGYTDLSANQLVQLSHADVDTEFVREMNELGFDGLSVQDLIQLSHADVDAALVAELSEMGFTDLTTEAIIHLSHADVDAEYVAALRAAGVSDLTPQSLMQLSHADVDAEYVEELRELGFPDLTAERLAQLSHADVDTEFVAAMQRLGLTDLSIQDLIQLSHADVDATFVEEMTALGYTGLSANQLVQLSHADIDTGFVEEMNELGFDNLSVQELIQLSHADVDAAFVAELSGLGFRDLTTEAIIQLSHADISAELVSELSGAGLTDLTPNALIQLGHAGVDADYIKEMRALGFTNLSAEKLIRLKHAGMDEAFIREMRGALQDNN